jgi:hypothetical protein
LIPNIVSQKGKDEPRSHYLGQIVQIAQALIVGEFISKRNDPVNTDTSEFKNCRLSVKNFPPYFPLNERSHSDLT